MSWGAAGASISNAFKQGLKQDMSRQGMQSMRDTNDPTGQGYGGRGAPAPAAAPAPSLDSLPATQGTPAYAPGVGPAAPLAMGPQQSSPLVALFHAIWGKPGQ